MNKLKNIFSFILIGLIVLAGGIFANFKIKEKSSNASENNLQSFNLQQSAEISPINPTSSSKIFSEYYGSTETGEGNNLISSLKITIPLGATDVNIMLNIMNNSFAQEKDEKGTVIPKQIENTNQTFYFTRTATYIVTYNYNNNFVSEDYYFTPQINTKALQSISTASPYSNIKYDKALNKYFILRSSDKESGTSEIIQSLYFDNDLYTLYLSDNYSKGTPFQVTSLTGRLDANTAKYDWTIPKNSYGKVTILLDSKYGYSSASVDIYVINVKYETYYFDYETNNSLDKAKYSYATTNTTTNDEIISNDGSANEDQYTNFVFNKGVTLNVNISKYAVYPISSSAPLEENAVQECFGFLEFSFEENVRNASNTAFIKTNPGTFNTLNSTASFNFSQVDNCTYTIKTTLKNSSTSAIINTNINKFKIITKIPVISTTSGTRYILALYLDGVTGSSRPETLNYFNICENGYITEDLQIYTTFENTYLQSYDNFGTSYTGGKFHYYIDYKEEYLTDQQGWSSDRVKLVKSEDNILPNGYQRTVLIERFYSTKSEINFDDFYTFTFNLIHNNNDITNNKYINYFTIDDKPSKEWYDEFHQDYNTTLEEVPEGSEIPEYDEFPTLSKTPVIKFTGDYNLTNCVPIYMQVTYNGRTYENFYTPKANDEIIFSEFGNYFIEIYTLPSYEFCYNFINESQITNSLLYYMSFSFNIAGPSIEVTSTDVNGRRFSLSNYMYTQNPFDIKVELNPGQNLVVYRNSEKIAEQSSSGTYNVPKEQALPGAYRVVVVDSNGKELRETTFTVADVYYQGFSINKKDEYEELLISLLNTEINEYEYLPLQQYYHLLDEGSYRVKVTNGEKINFSVKNGNTITQANASIHITNYINFEIKKSYFSITFQNAKAGDKITEDITITGYDGIEIQLIEVFLDGKLIDTIETNKEASITDAFTSSMTYDQSGQYTIKLTDKYGNSTEFMIEKYYQANAALIVLIILVAVGLLILLWLLFKSRRGLKVK